MIRERAGDTSQEAVVELCLACVRVGCIKKAGSFGDLDHSSKLQSFKVLAACCLLREMHGLRTADPDNAGGGFVGVGGRR